MYRTSWTQTNNDALQTITIRAMPDAIDHIRVLAVCILPLLGLALALLGALGREHDLGPLLVDATTARSGQVVLEGRRERRYVRGG